MGIASLLTSASLFGYNKWFLVILICVSFFSSHFLLEALSGRLLLACPAANMVLLLRSRLPCGSVLISELESIASPLTYSSPLGFQDTVSGWCSVSLSGNFFPVSLASFFLSSLKTLGYSK